MDKFFNPILNTEQEALAAKLDFTAANLYHPVPNDCICTFDVIYKDGKATVGIDVTLYPNHPVSVETFYTTSKGEYIPGYFSFYEGPVILETLQWLSEINIIPKLIIVDGHGLAHPRKFGLACYVGVHTGLPVIGVAKESLMPYDKNTLPGKKNAMQELKLDDETLGVAIRLQADKKSVFISAGNKIDLETSINIIQLLTSEYKNPDVLRRADKASRKEG